MIGNCPICRTQVRLLNDWLQGYCPKCKVFYRDIEQFVAAYGEDSFTIVLPLLPRRIGAIWLLGLLGRNNV